MVEPTGGLSVATSRRGDGKERAKEGQTSGPVGSAKVARRRGCGEGVAVGWHTRDMFMPARADV